MLADSVGIVGGGVVGSATARSLLEHVGEVRVYDVRPEKRTHGFQETVSAEWVFFCLPTDGAPQGYDLRPIEETFGKLRGKHQPLILRSTVQPRTTQELAQRFDLPGLMHMPEALTARCAFTDSQIPARTIIGHTSFDLSQNYARELAGLYLKRFPGVPVHIVPSEASELIKLAVNSFFAVKVAYWNHIFHLCQKLGLNYDDVRGGALSDGRIAHAHTAVPGGHGFGFSGYCLVPETIVESKKGLVTLADIAVGDQLWDGEDWTAVTAKASRVVPRTVKIQARGHILEGSEDHLHLVCDGHALQEVQLGTMKTKEDVYLPRPAPDERPVLECGAPPNGKVRVWHENLPWSDDLAWLCGIWLAEGYTAPDAKTVWTLGPSEEAVADRIIAALEALGLHARAKLVLSANATFGPSTTLKVICSSQWLRHLVHRILDLGTSCYNKRVPHGMPDVAGMHLVGGWLDGDGSQWAGTIGGHSESRTLILGLDGILRRNGICAVLGNKARRLCLSRRQDVQRIAPYTTRLKFDASRYIRSFAYGSPTCSEWGDGWLAKVSKVTWESEDKEVVAIETSSGRYVANGLCTHNCLPKDNAAMAATLRREGLSDAVPAAAQAYNRILRGEKE